MPYDSGPPNLPAPGSPELAELVARIQTALPLSPAQATVALGLRHGLTEDQVAAWLGRSTDTVHTHVRNSYERLRPLRYVGRAGLVVAIERALNGSSG